MKTLMITIASVLIVSCGEIRGPISNSDYVIITGTQYDGCAGVISEIDSYGWGELLMHNCMVDNLNNILYVHTSGVRRP